MRRLTLVAGLAAALVGVMTWGGGSAAGGAPRGGAVGHPAPAIAASATTPTQSSVVIAMGHLHDPANTFWELFLRPAGSPTWVLHTPPGVASNGGLVVAAPPSGSLTVGFLTSADLKFSPVALRPDGGTSWSPGELPSPLAVTPDALAVGPQGQVLALVRGGQRVVTTSGDLSIWHASTSASTLGSGAATCGVRGVTAVGFDADSQPLLGLACSHGGDIGVLGSLPSSGGWRMIGPSIDAGDGAASVVRLVTAATGPEGLARLQSGTRVSLVGFWASAVTDQWAHSSPLPVPPGWTVEATATGGGAGPGLAVLLGSGDRRRVEDVAGSGAPWVTRRGSPSGSSGISLVGSEIDTFVVKGSHLAVWALTPGSTGWRRTASITVPVPYGSSS